MKNIYSTAVCLVARTGWRHQEKSEDMQSMPAVKEQPTSNSTSQGEWPQRPWVRVHADYAGIHGEDVPCVGGCSFQMD